VEKFSRSHRYVEGRKWADKALSWNGLGKIIAGFRPKLSEKEIESWYPEYHSKHMDPKPWEETDPAAQTTNLS